MKTLTVSLLSIIFLSLAVTHFYWGFGGKSGHSASIPTKTNGTPIINPGKTGCFVVAAGLLIFGVFVLIKGGIISVDLPAWLLYYGM